MARYMASIDQYPLFLVFLERSKEYDTLDRGCLLQTLEEYREGEKMHGILVEFWENQELVTR